ncbi:MAG: hypothetical protein ACYTG7_04880 [Planctomycetota bacterium]|jgi:hypothetical protein
MTRRGDKLEAEGWTRRSVATEPRLSEIVELYEDIGFEVRLEPHAEEENSPDAQCTVCMEEDRDRFKVVYTRPIAEE